MAWLFVNPPGLGLRTLLVSPRVVSPQARESCVRLEICGYYINFTPEYTLRAPHGIVSRRVMSYRPRSRCGTTFRGPRHGSFSPCPEGSELARRTTYGASRRRRRYGVRFVCANHTQIVACDCRDCHGSIHQRRAENRLCVHAYVRTTPECFGVVVLAGGGWGAEGVCRSLFQISGGRGYRTCRRGAAGAFVRDTNQCWYCTPRLHYAKRCILEVYQKRNRPMLDRALRSGPVLSFPFMSCFFCFAVND